jgi:hypothetical protein
MRRFRLIEREEGWYKWQELKTYFGFKLWRDTRVIASCDPDNAQRYLEDYLNPPAPFKPRIIKEIEA